MIFSIALIYTQSEINVSNNIKHTVMKNGSSLRYLTNIILYLIIIFASLDILNHFLSPGSHQISASALIKAESGTLTCRDRLAKITLERKKPPRWSTFTDEKKCCPANITASLSNDQIADSFKKCALSHWEVGNAQDYEFHFKDGVIFKHNSFSFECYSAQIDKQSVIIIRQKTYTSFKHEVINLVMEGVFFLLGNDTQSRIKQFLFKINLSYDQWILHFGLIAAGIYIFFGSGLDKLKKIFPSKKDAPQKNIQSHNQKIEDGFKLIEYLHHFQKEKMKDFNIKERKNVPEIVQLIKFIEKIDHTSIKLISGNQGVGLESSLQFWTKKKIYNGGTIIYYNLKFLIDCNDRLGLENKCVPNLDCILEAIIFENDRYIVSILITMITMTTNYCFKFVLHTINAEIIVAVKILFAILIGRYFLLNQQQASNFKDNQMTLESTIYYFVFEGAKIISFIIIFFIFYFQALKNIFYRLKETVQQWEVLSSLKQGKKLFKLETWKYWLRKEKPKQNKTIILIDNFQLVMQEFSENKQRPNQGLISFQNFLKKCHQAQQLKNHDILLVSRSLNCTDFILRRNTEHSTADFKYEEYNVHHLQLKSVMKVIKYRDGDKDNNELLPYSLLFSYFFDSTEQIFKSMRSVRIDTKYNEEDCFRINGDNHKKQQLLGNILMEINRVIKEARNRIEYKLRDDIIKDYCTKKVKLPQLNEGEWRSLTQQILNKLLNVILFQMKYNSQEVMSEEHRKTKIDQRILSKSLRKNLDQMRNILINKESVNEQIVNKMNNIIKILEQNDSKTTSPKHSCEKRENKMEKIEIQQEKQQHLSLQIQPIPKSDIYEAPYLTQSRKLIEQQIIRQNSKIKEKGQQILKQLQALAEIAKQDETSAEIKRIMIPIEELQNRIKQILDEYGFDILDKNSKQKETRQAIYFMKEWYKFSKKRLLKQEFQIICSQFKKDKYCEAIINYLNDKRIFYFYSFSSSINAFAYFTISYKIDKEISLSLNNSTLITWLQSMQPRLSAQENSSKSVSEPTSSSTANQNEKLKKD